MKKNIGMDDILQLVRAGYTREEIDGLIGVFDEDTPEAQEQPAEATKETETDKQPEKPAEAPEKPQEAPKAETMNNEAFQAITDKLDALTKAIQASNLKGSTLPEIKVDNIEDILQKFV